MDKDHAGPSKSKRSCVNKFPDKREIQFLLDTDDEDNLFDFEDSGRECSVERSVIKTPLCIHIIC